MVWTDNCLDRQWSGQIAIKRDIGKDRKLSRHKMVRRDNREDRQWSVETTINRDNGQDR